MTPLVPSAENPGMFLFGIQKKYKGNTAREARRGDFGVSFFGIQGQYNGNPARKARRGKIPGMFFRNTKEVQRAKRAGENPGVCFPEIQREYGARSARGGILGYLFFEIQWEYNGNPAREARRGETWGMFFSEIQRKSGARSAPGVISGYFFQSTAETPPL